MEEEGARRRAYNGRGGAGARGFLHGLNEDDEGDADDEGVVNEARHKRGQVETDSVAPAGAGAKAVAARNLAGATSVVNAVPERSLWDGRAGQRDRGRRTGGKGFELDMDNATLLGRRHKKGAAAGAVADSSPLARGILPPSRVEDTTLPPGSPMHTV